mmetsp:Transcript_3317/g.4645  ORF Transcript_3317/g.4645 Transcript_3317/m.4645 type:complete len:388 (-) Transcript_3317:415-1578(-)|eukprot:CAMPEP_0184860744 /NCGR_PEP_ID=MMETSP0580-20130426/5564_1 /TAXON_ID=1118495 /ORGANISM="Dactyliosolen fragilissimus" /LENGTH=387 /DNA_ID=CAMNT_0027357957 /DNA_START=929 /DNA_END=2092 /DNA_ORIENTATION=+
MATTKYSFHDDMPTALTVPTKKSHRKNKQRNTHANSHLILGTTANGLPNTFNNYESYHCNGIGGDADTIDGNGSLTYSASSSVLSNNSLAGESTDDSSFAESHLMKVLDINPADSRQAAHYDHIRAKPKGGQASTSASPSPYGILYEYSNGEPQQQIAVTAQRQKYYRGSPAKDFNGRQCSRNHSGNSFSGDSSSYIDHSEDERGENSSGYFGDEAQYSSAPPNAIGQTREARAPEGGSENTHNHHKETLPKSSSSSHSSTRSPWPKTKRNKSISPPVRLRSNPTQERANSHSTARSNYKYKSSPNSRYVTRTTSENSISSSSGKDTPTSHPPRNRANKKGGLMGGSNSKTSGNRRDSGKGDEKDEGWYAQWWMCGFTDAFNFKPSR